MKNETGEAHWYPPPPPIPVLYSEAPTFAYTYGYTPSDYYPYTSCYPPASCSSTVPFALDRKFYFIFYLKFSNQSILVVHHHWICNIWNVWRNKSRWMFSIADENEDVSFNSKIWHFNYSILRNSKLQNFQNFIAQHMDHSH